MPSAEQGMKLDRMRELLRRLGNPQDRLPIVHVAGTKGKGSTAAMIAGMLCPAGYPTGLFTSPHLERIEERIAIDGQPCPPETFAELVETVRPAVEAMDREMGGSGEWSVVSGQWSVVEGVSSAAEPDIHPSSFIPHPSPSDPSLGPTYFEILTAMAFCHFARRAKIAVVEVGLGGRLDSTNVCTPLAAIITSISLDHIRQLGETPAAIAAEKAGIIKPGVPVISGVTEPEPREVVRRIAAERGCRLLELGVDFDFRYDPPRHLEQSASPARFEFVMPAGKGVRHLLPERPFGCSAQKVPNSFSRPRSFALGLLGRHQAANAAVALATVEELRQAGWAISEPAVRHGLAELAWPARIEVVARRPTVILDGAHNGASVRSLVETLAESFSARRRLLVFATTREKDIPGMLEHLLRHFDRVIFTRYQNNPRGVPAEELLAAAAEMPRAGAFVAGAVEMELAPTTADAWDAVHRLVEPDDVVCITGSFFLAAEMRRHIARRPLGFPVQQWLQT